MAFLRKLLGVTIYCDALGETKRAVHRYIPATSSRFERETAAAVFTLAFPYAYSFYMAPMAKAIRSTPSAPASVIIQIDIPGTGDVDAGLDRARKSLQKAGVIIDEKYSPVRIGLRSSRRYALRGVATEAAAKAASKQLSVTIFPDLEIGAPER